MKDVKIPRSLLQCASLCRVFQVVVKNDAPVGDVILDEALKHIKETATPETLQNWVDYLSG